MLSKAASHRYRIFSGLVLTVWVGSYCFAADPPTVTAGQTRWTVLGVENRGSKIKPTRPLSAARRPNRVLVGLRSTFLFVTVKVENLSERSKEAAAQKATLIDARGRQFNNINWFYDSHEEDYLAPGNSAFSPESMTGTNYLRPGIPRTFQMIYEVPVDAAGLQLEAYDLDVPLPPIGKIEESFTKIPLSVQFSPSSPKDGMNAPTVTAGTTRWTLLGAFDRGAILKPIAHKDSPPFISSSGLSEEGAKFVEIIARIENEDLAPKEAWAGGVRLIDKDGREFKMVDVMEPAPYRSVEDSFVLLPHGVHFPPLNPNVPKDFSLIFMVGADSHIDRFKVVDMGRSEQPATAELSVIVKSLPVPEKQRGRITGKKHP